MHGLEQFSPAGPVHLARGNAEVLDDVGIEPLVVQSSRDVVNARRIRAVHDGLGVDVAHEGDLAVHRLGNRSIAAQHDGIRLDTDRAQCRDRVLGRLGLLLARGVQVRHERHVHEEAIGATDFVADLARRLEERLGLDVADRSADLGDDDIRSRLVLGLQPHPALDLVGDVRDDLNGVAQILAAALPGDHGGVDLAGRDVGGLAQVDVEEAFVVADVEVGLRPIVRHEDLAVLEGVHGAGIHVQIWIELLHDDAKTPRCEQVAEAGGREPFTKTRDDTPGDENVLCCLRVMFDHHGVTAYHREYDHCLCGRPQSPLPLIDS